MATGTAQAESLSKEGAAVVSRTVAGVRAIHAAVADSAGKIAELSRRSERNGDRIGPREAALV